MHKIVSSPNDDSWFVVYANNYEERSYLKYILVTVGFLLKNLGTDDRVVS